MELTGTVIYPVAQIINKEADELEQNAAEDLSIPDFRRRKNDFPEILF